jgi:hypothetical protein
MMDSSSHSSSSPASSSASPCSAIRAGLNGAHAHATALLQPRQQHDGSALLK